MASDDVGNVVCPCSPILRRIVRELGTELTDAAKAIAESAGEFSHMDALAMNANYFVSAIAGEQVIETAKGVAAARLEQPVSFWNGQSSSDKPHDDVVLEDIFKKHLGKPKPWELGEFPSSARGGSSGQQETRAALDSIVTELIALMDDSIRERFLNGYSELPKAVRSELLHRAVRGDKGADHFKGVRDALARFKKWSVVKFGVFRGFEADDARVAWFFLDNLVSDDLDGHVSKNLYAGLKAAADTYKFPFSFSAPLASMCKAPAHMPKQAPSASVACVYHFWSVASDTSLSTPLRGISAVFLVMCLAALRGIDAQRSVFDSRVDSGRGYAFFTAVAWDSKGKTSMPWACPLQIFDSSQDWYDALRQVWGDRDYLFASVERGASLAASSQMSQGRASAYLVLRYLREIVVLPPLSMNAADAKRLRRHSFRHFLPNCVRLLKFSLPEAFQAGRWKDHNVMPLRYALEVKFTTMVEIIVKVVQRCAEALERVTFAQWPAFGGWEHLLPPREWSSTGVAAAVTFQAEPEGDEADDDSDDEGVESHEDERAVDAETARPSGQGPLALPEGWHRIDQVLSSGTIVPHYYGPNGMYSRSRVGAWRQAGAVASGSSAEIVQPSCSQAEARVATPEPVASESATPAQALKGGRTSVGLARSYEVEEVSPSKCGTPGCTVVCPGNHVHSGICIFPPVSGKRRRN